MKLTDLKAKFYSTGGPGITDSTTGEPVPLRTGMGVMLNCPCRQCGQKLLVPFKNPIGGGEPHAANVTWTREGETIETLTLSPSIRRIPFNGSCGWHGFIRNGEVETCSDSTPPTPEFVAANAQYSDED